MQPIQSFMPIIGVVLLVLGLFVFRGCRSDVKVAGREIPKLAKSQAGTAPGAMGRALTMLLRGLSVAAMGFGLILLGIAFVQ